MEVQLEEKSRRQKRKEARLSKQKNRYLSWIEHQKSSKSKGNNVGVKPKVQKKSKAMVDEISQEREVQESVVNDEIDEQPPLLKKSKAALGSSEDLMSSDVKVKKEKKSLKRKSKTKFDEYLEMEMKKGMVSAEEDLELERKLAKKLKVKGGKLRRADDELNVFFDGISSILDEEDLGDEEDKRTFKDRSSSKKRKKKSMPIISEQRDEDEQVTDVTAGGSEPVESDVAKVSEEEPALSEQAVDRSVKYISPHLRSNAGKESEECSQIRRQVRGLLNKLSESNVESITEEISTIFRSTGRSVGSQIISEEILVSCSKGPRGTEHFCCRDGMFSWDRLQCKTYFFPG